MTLKDQLLIARDRMRDAADKTYTVDLQELSECLDLLSEATKLVDGVLTALNHEDEWRHEITAAR
jgi:hypothetical protein